MLIAAAFLTLVLWQLPFGRTLLYPFTLFATYAHEMGHGLTAELVGGQFVKLIMHMEGSGTAFNLIPQARLPRALVAAGGLLGPAMLGAVILIISRWMRATWILNGFALLMLLSVIFYTRGAFAPAFTLAVALAFALTARLSPQSGAPFLVQLLGVQLCLAVFQDIDYMFSNKAEVEGQVLLSDSAVIADALFLPYWFWGACIAILSLLLLALGLFVALRPHGNHESIEEATL